MKLTNLAKELKKTPDGMTKTIARAVRRRREDTEFLDDLDDLDRKLACVSE